jgi:hypothetical protein
MAAGLGGTSTPKKSTGPASMGGLGGASMGATGSTGTLAGAMGVGGASPAGGSGGGSSPDMNSLLSLLGWGGGGGGYPMVTPVQGGWGGLSEMLAYGAAHGGDISGYGGGSGGGGGGAGGFNNTAQTYPGFDSLLKKYMGWAECLESGSDRVMDMAGQKYRDAREGGLKSLRAGNRAAGRISSPNESRYQSETTRGVQQAVADTAIKREAMIGAAYAGALPLTAAGPNMALAEKNLGLQQVVAQNQMANSSFNNFLALLQALRSSPTYQQPSSSSQPGSAIGAGGGGIYTG